MYEVDFLAVGKEPGDKCGDAIVLRFAPENADRWLQVRSTQALKTTGKLWLNMSIGTTNRAGWISPSSPIQMRITSTAWEK